MTAVQGHSIPDRAGSGAEIELDFRRILDALGDPVIAADANNRIIYINHAVEELLGWTAENLVGLPLTTIVPPRFRAAHLAGFSRYLTTRTPRIIGRPIRVPALHRDGSEIDIELSLAALTTNGDEPLFVATLRDVRDRVELERQLTGTRDEFLSSISHDLKNPLTALKGQAQLLRRRAERMTPEDRERILKGLTSIMTTATRMNRLINDLVDDAHLRIGRPLQLNRESTDLLALVRHLTEIHQDTAADHTIVLESAVPELLGTWDSARLERVITNLLSNAVKYSLQGGTISITLSRDESEAGPLAVLSVRDQGIGIPLADVDHIFERFFRASNVVPHIAGTGVGLAAAKQIVEQHGGTIAVESREGEGTTFTVRLPVG